LPEWNLFRLYENNGLVPCTLHTRVQVLYHLTYGSIKNTKESFSV
jgi:hypothetical protein